MNDSHKEVNNSPGSDRVSDGFGESDIESAVARACRGEREALVELYDRYAERVFRYALVGLKSYSDAEDATSEVFLGVVKGIRRFEWRGPGSFESWLFRIAHNVVTSEIRRKAKQRTELIGESDKLPIQPDPGVEEKLITNGALGELWGRVARMPETQREVLLLRFMAGLSAEETGRILGKSAGAVRILQYRALAALRSEIRGVYV